jgi:hypothetical protein
MSAGKYDIVIEQGTTLNLVAKYYDSASALVDLTSFTARAKFRTTYDSSSTVILNLTTENSGIALGGTAGSITLSAAATATAALSAPSSGVYDLEIVTAGGVVTRLMEGKYKITPEATR